MNGAGASAPPTRIMTKDDAVPVTAEDREAAAEYMRRFPDLRLPEAFARHRLASLSQTPATPTTASDFLGMFDGPMGVVNRYRKTALITATQWFKDGDHPAVRMYDDIDGTGNLVGWIDTLEGGHIVTPGDWIATGVQGEHWAIKPDVFAATYEPATPMVQEGLREAAQAVVDEAARMTMTMRRRKIFDALAAALADRTQEGEVRRG